MELIKKIKETEAQAQEIVEQARADAVAMSEEHRKKRGQTMEQAEHERKKAIDSSVAGAASQAQTEIKTLRAKAEQDRTGLRDKTRPAIAGAVTKVMDFLKG